MSGEVPQAAGRGRHRRVVGADPQRGGGTEVNQPQDLTPGDCGQHGTGEGHRPSDGQPAAGNSTHQADGSGSEKKTTLYRHCRHFPLCPHAAKAQKIGTMTDPWM